MPPLLLPSSVLCLLCGARVTVYQGRGVPGHVTPHAQTSEGMSGALCPPPCVMRQHTQRRRRRVFCRRPCLRGILLMPRMVSWKSFGNTRGDCGIRWRFPVASRACWCRKNLVAGHWSGDLTPGDGISGVTCGRQFYSLLTLRSVCRNTDRSVPCSETVGAAPRGIWDGTSLRDLGREPHQGTRAADTKTSQLMVSRRRVHRTLVG